MQALGKEIKDVSRAGRKKDQDFENWKAIQGARVLLVEDNEINQHPKSLSLNPKPWPPSVINSFNWQKILTSMVFKS
jgi:hypothetical protein